MCQKWALGMWAKTPPFSFPWKKSLSQELIGLKVCLDALLCDFVPRRLYGIIKVIGLPTDDGEIMGNNMHETNRLESQQEGRPFFFG